MHSCVFIVCGKGHTWGPSGSRSIGRSLRYPLFQSPTKQALLHSTMERIIWLVYCRSEVTKYPIGIDQSILEKLPLLVSSSFKTFTVSSAQPSGIREVVRAWGGRWWKLKLRLLRGVGGWREHFNRLKIFLAWWGG